MDVAELALLEADRGIAEQVMEQEKVRLSGQHHD